MFHLIDFCRLCLTFDGEFNNMCYDNTMEKVLACISDLEFDDHLPALICTNCMEKLDLFFEFRNRCLQSEFLLNNYIEKFCANTKITAFINTKLRVNVLKNFATTTKLQSNVKVYKRCDSEQDRKQNEVILENSENIKQVVDKCSTNKNDNIIISNKPQQWNSSISCKLDEFGKLHEDVHLSKIQEQKTEQHVNKSSTIPENVTFNIIEISSEDEDILDENQEDEYQYKDKFATTVNHEEEGTISKGESVEHTEEQLNKHSTTEEHTTDNDITDSFPDLLTDLSERVKLRKRQVQIRAQGKSYAELYEDSPSKNKKQKIIKQSPAYSPNKVKSIDMNKVEKKSSKTTGLIEKQVTHTSHLTSVINSTLYSNTQEETSCSPESQEVVIEDSADAAVNISNSLKNQFEIVKNLNVKDKTSQPSNNKFNATNIGIFRYEQKAINSNEEIVTSTDYENDIVPHHISSQQNFNANSYSTDVAVNISNSIKNQLEIVKNLNVKDKTSQPSNNKLNATNIGIFRYKPKTINSSKEIVTSTDYENDIVPHHISSQQNSNTDSNIHPAKVVNNTSKQLYQDNFQNLLKYSIQYTKPPQQKQQVTYKLVMTSDRKPLKIILPARGILKSPQQSTLNRGYQQLSNPMILNCSQLKMNKKILPKISPVKLTGLSTCGSSQGLHILTGFPKTVNSKSQIILSLPQKSNTSSVTCVNNICIQNEPFTNNTFKEKPIENYSNLHISSAREQNSSSINWALQSENVKVVDVPTLNDDPKIIDTSYISNGDNGMHIDFALETVVKDSPPANETKDIFQTSLIENDCDKTSLTSIEVSLQEETNLNNESVGSASKMPIKSETDLDFEPMNSAPAVDDDVKPMLSSSPIKMDPNTSNFSILRTRLQTGNYSDSDIIFNPVDDHIKPAPVASSVEIKPNILDLPASSSSFQKGNESSSLTISNPGESSQLTEENIHLHEKLLRRSKRKPIDKRRYKYTIDDPLNMLQPRKTSVKRKKYKSPKLKKRTVWVDHKLDRGRKTVVGRWHFPNPAFNKRFAHKSESDDSDFEIDVVTVDKNQRSFSPYNKSMDDLMNRKAWREKERRAKSRMLLVNLASLLPTEMKPTSNVTSAKFILDSTTLYVRELYEKWKSLNDEHKVLLSKQHKLLSKLERLKHKK